jgi:hypothetical protein
MKKALIFCLLVLLLQAMLFCGPALSKTFSDSKYRFKIDVPDNWVASTYLDGPDQVYAFISSDQKIAVRVRAFAVDSAVGLEAVISAFETNLLQRSARAKLEDYSLNGIPGQAGAYTWNVNGTDYGVGAFFAIYNSNAYIVWSIIPVTDLAARGAESDAITGTFVVDQAAVADAADQAAADGPKVTVNKVRTGSRLSGKYKLAADQRRFVQGNPELFTVFEYSGPVTREPFLVKWIHLKTKEILKEDKVGIPVSKGGQGVSKMKRPNKGWPGGDYAVEIWYGGEKLATGTFNISGR